MDGKFTASDEFIASAQSLSGMATRIRTQYGSIGEMVESASWDEGKTGVALSMIKALEKEVRTINKELARHVTEKFG